MTANATDGTDGTDGERSSRGADLRRLLKRSRPRFWLYLAGPAMVGLAYGAESVPALLSPLSAALVLFFLLPANVFLYGVNDVFDADIDAENPKKEDKEVRYGGDRLTLVSVLASLGLGVALLVALPAPARPWLAGFLVLGAAYSAPPLRLKVRPPLDSVSNGLYILPGAAAWAATTGTAPPTLALVGSWLWTMAMHTFSAIPDIEPDRRGGIRTTATVLGGKGALAYCFGCWLLAAVVWSGVAPAAGALFAVYPVFAVAVGLSGVDIDRAYWWFPYLNTVVGMVLTLGGLWGLTHA
jgi:4-hydroxybenzoate polyprenyltransferase